jgi:transcriptional regulator GlxA family with amidase domain
MEQQVTINPRNVAVILFDDVEVLDFAGPFEIFSVTGRRSEGEPPFNVYTVSMRPGPVIARNHLSINPLYTLADCPLPDIVIVPGGIGTRREMNNPVLIEWLQRQATRAELMTSVCTGALVLARAGLLDGLEATTHHSSYDLLEQTANVRVRRDVRYVDNGKVITSAGVQAGMDMALHIVARLLGHEAAAETARYIEYEWREASQA